LILKEVETGGNSESGVGAMVVKDVPKNKIWVRNSAKFIRSIHAA
jgi:acetyltransferase-like isoleucine patch superfamily enzyme